MGVKKPRLRWRCLLPLLALSLAACRTAPAPEKPPARLPPAAFVAAPPVAGAGFRVLPPLPPPDRLRPCCTFGHDLRVRALGVPIPLFRLGNIVDPAQLGRHRYNGGSTGFVGGFFGSDAEKLGLVYTRRGGFIDTAHVRDSADNTLFLFSRIWPRLGEAWTLTLEPELAERRIAFAAFAPPASPAERYALAAQLAARLSFQIAVWHEIAQWYGYRTVRSFSERSSAFSPEDLYSNALGARLSLMVELQGDADSVRHYDAALTRLLPRALATLAAVSADETRAALDRLDGCWWDSRARLPARFLLLYRDYDVSSRRLPLRPPGETAPAQALAVPERWQNTPLDDYAGLRLYPGTSMHRLPSPPARGYWTAADFAALAQAAARTDAAEPRVRAAGACIGAEPGPVQLPGARRAASRVASSRRRVGAGTVLSSAAAQRRPASGSRGRGRS